MISAVNPYGTNYTLSSYANASIDYLNLALVVDSSKKLLQSTHEFIYSFDPHKMYLNVQNMNSRKTTSYISTYA